tara:strand:+ start:708 stop:1787 length:1080 start_codon:yes stop_codon:yes gene_type:complete
MVTSPEPLLEIKDVRTHFFLDEGTVRAVDGVDLTINKGEVVGIVGESGCGKSVLARSIMRLTQPPGRLVSGDILYHRTAKDQETEIINIANLPRNGTDMRRIRGSEMTMIFQEPMASFSPVHTIGSQIIEGILLHDDVSKEEARNRTVELLGKVGIPDPQLRVDEYPFNLSGGMRQRCMIAMALSGNPSLLIADEPTTALDVTTQAQILELLGQLQADIGMAMILITHNLGVVAQMAKQIVVMYLGNVVENTDVETLFEDPKHPYSEELLKAIPRLQRTRQRDRLTPISGNVPSWRYRPSGCNFMPKCDGSNPACAMEDPILIEESPGHWVSFCGPCRETHGCKWFPREIIDTDGGNGA